MSAPFGLCDSCGKRMCDCRAAGALLTLAPHPCPDCHSTLAGDEPCVTCHSYADVVLISLGHRLRAGLRLALDSIGARRW